MSETRATYHTRRNRKWLAECIQSPAVSVNAVLLRTILEHYQDLLGWTDQGGVSGWRDVFRTVVTALPEEEALSEAERKEKVVGEYRQQAIWCEEMSRDADQDGDKEYSEYCLRLADWWREKAALEQRKPSIVPCQVWAVQST